MLKKIFKCSVLTPEAQVFDDEVDLVVLPAHDGEIGILLDRAPLVCKLGVGSLRLRDHIRTHIWFVEGGFAQVIDNQVTVLAQKALGKEEISVAEAHARLEEARRMPAGNDAAARRKEQALTSARALIRMASRQTPST